ncbi:hypothetical protein diail_412 [Diaporthe ilicicola]|nr:hypothetical protein diail_412 [Diaporthe ilicicola]
MKTAVSVFFWALGLLVSKAHGTGSVGQAEGSIDTSPQPFDLNGSNYTYPYPVKVYNFESQFQELQMAFMDVPHAENVTCNGQVAVLFHGKNFCGPTWIQTINELRAHGYRVIAVDQVGFCKSSKPESYQFSLQQFASSTSSLLNALDISEVTVIGHSLGGMLAARYSMMYPSNVTELVLVDPMGLEDWLEAGVPYPSLEYNWQSENATTWASIKAYEQATYYVGSWDASYDEWVTMSDNIYHGSERRNFLAGQARVVDMVLTQPIAHSFASISPRTLLVTGDKDNTAVGKLWSPPDVAARLGNYSVLGPQTAAQIPNCTFIHYPDQGHAPHLEIPEQFHKDLFAWLRWRT